jgi:hypothetical protein
MNTENCQTVKFDLSKKCWLNFCPCNVKKILQNLHIFDELMIYFVSYVLGLAKSGRENAISDNLETPNFQPFSNILPSFPCNSHL